MEWLAGVGHRGGGHGHLQAAEDVVEFLRPVHPVLFRDSQVHRNAHEHLLDTFHEPAVSGADEIPVCKQVETRVFEEFRAFRLHVRRQFCQLFRGIGSQERCREQTLVREPYQFVLPGSQAESLFIAGDLRLQFMVQDPGCNVLPLWGIAAGELSRRAFQEPQAFRAALVRADEFRGLDLQPVQGVFALGEVFLHLCQQIPKRRVLCEFRQPVHDLPHVRVCLAVENVGLCGFVEAAFHQRLFCQVLDLFHLTALLELRRDPSCHVIELCISHGLAGGGESPRDRPPDFFWIEDFHVSASFADGVYVFCHVVIPYPFCVCVLFLAGSRNGGKDQHQFPV